MRPSSIRIARSPRYAPCSTSSIRPARTMTVSAWAVGERSWRRRVRARNFARMGFICISAGSVPWQPGLRLWATSEILLSMTPPSIGAGKGSGEVEAFVYRFPRASLHPDNPFGTRSFRRPRGPPRPRPRRAVRRHSRPAQRDHRRRRREVGQVDADRGPRGRPQGAHRRHRDPAARARLRSRRRFRRLVRAERQRRDDRDAPGSRSRGCSKAR